MQVQQQGGQALDVLKIVLEQLCLSCKPDAALLCRLLCCSTYTTELVHQTCAGQLAVTTTKVYHKGSAWLAKHAQLLRELSLKGTWEDLEQWVAAGLCAAAGARRVLPLQQLQLEGRLEGKSLPTTISACCTQLAQLHATAVPDPNGYRRYWPDFPVNFSCLCNLQELKIACTKPWTDATLQSLSSLTQLTALHMPRLDSIEHLPVSLVELGEDLKKLDSVDREFEAAEVVTADLQHLTNLTYLQLGAVEGPEQLPRQLRELRVQDFDGMRASCS